MKADRTLAAPARVRVVTLGSFAVEVAGEPLSARQYGQRKPLALLKVLIACGAAGAHIERLSDALWPDLDGDRAKQAFTVALHRLRRMIGASALPLRDATLVLDGSQVFVDAWEFALLEAEATAALQRGADAAALTEFSRRVQSLYGGPFLDGDFGSTEVLSFRSGLHHAFLSTVHAVGTALCAAGADDPAIAFYRRALTVDSLAEELYLGLIDCYVRRGRRAEALRTGRECGRILGTALGSGPSAAMQARLAALEAAPEGGPTAPSVTANGDRSPHPAEPAQAAVIPLPLGAPATPAAGGPAPPAITRRRLLRVAGLAALVGLPAGTTAWLCDCEWWGATPPEALLERDGFPRYRPSPLAVVPYAGPADAPAQRALSRDMVERLYALLVKFPQLDVPVRNAREGRQAPDGGGKTLGAAAGATHVAEVQVHEPNGELAVGSRLIRVADGQVLWSRNYALPDGATDHGRAEVASQISRHLVGHLAYGEQGFLLKNTFANDPAGWEALAEAQALTMIGGSANVLAASRVYERLLQANPDSLIVTSLLSFIFMELARHHWVPDIDEAWRRALALARRADEMDPRHVRGNAIQAYYHSYHQDHAQAQQLVERYFAAFNSDPAVYRTYGEILMFAGRTAESIWAIKEHARRMPSYPAHIITVLELDYYLEKRYELAVAAATVALSRAPRRARSLVALAASQAALGNLAAAREAVRKLMQSEPNYRAFSHARWVFRPMRDKSPQMELVQRLLDAGMPA